MSPTPSLDPVLFLRDLRKERHGFDWLFLAACLLVFGFSLFMYTWQFQFTVTDLFVHARIASEFDFGDLHTITSRLAYPMWHLCVSVLFQLGVPLIWASAIVCAAAKTLGMWLVRLLLAVVTQKRVSRAVLTLTAFALMFVTGIRIPGVNTFVYRGVGSPTVWHNPTQLMVIVTMLLCVPYIAHCWHDFERRLPEQGEKAMLSWGTVAVLATLLMLSLACKPTFMQALIPAAALFFLVQWIRYPKNSRYFFQIILAFLPAALYFLLQYLYYTGVVVPYTSGVAFGATPDTVWLAIRNTLIMAAFPLFALLCCDRKEMRRDKMLVLTLLMVVVSAVESMFFRETGIRQGHGNFNWAGMSTALMLWVLMAGHFLRSFAVFLQSPKKPRIRFAAFGVALGLLAWHMYSGIYYIYLLLASSNSF